MNKKIVVILTVTILLFSVLTGCTKESSGNQNNDQSSQVTMEDKKVTNQETEEKSQEPIRISWMDYSAYNVDIQDNVLKELEDLENIYIEIQHVANDYQTALKTRINAGDIPDVFVTGGGTDNSTYMEYSCDLTGNAILDKFMPWTLNDCTYENKVLGIPINIESFALIYNKELFEEAGIVDLPKTLSELRESCEVLKSNGITAFSNGYQEGWVLFMHQVTPFLSSTGLSPQELAQAITNGSVSFETMEAFDNYFDYIDITVEYGLAKPLETNWEKEEVAVATGEAALMHMGAWCEPVLIKANPDVSVAFLPTPISEKPEEAKISSGVSWVARISKTSKNKEAAIRAVDYLLTSESGMNFTIKENGFVLPLKEVTVEAEGLLVTSVNEILQDSDAYAWPFVYWPEGFSEAAASSIQAYIAGSINREEAKQQVQEAWMDLASN